MKNKKKPLSFEEIRTFLSQRGFKFRKCKYTKQKQMYCEERYEIYEPNTWHIVNDTLVIYLAELLKLAPEPICYISRSDVHDVVDYLASQEYFDPIEDHLVSTVYEYQRLASSGNIFTDSANKIRAEAAHEKEHTLSEMNKLLDFIKFKHEWHKEVVKCWLYGCMYKLINNKHQNFVLIINGKQGIGKSRFFDTITVNAGLRRYYITEHPKPYDKDHLLHLTNKLVWCINEIGTIFRRSDRDQLKEIFTKLDVTVRKVYEREPDELSTICSFCGTTNDDNILNDPTGNRRYFIIEMLEADWGLIDSVVDTRMMWLQIYNDIMYRNGEYKAFVTEDLKEKAKEAAEEAMIPSEAEMILDELLIRRKDKFVQTTHLAAILQKKSRKSLKLEHFYLDVADYIKRKDYVKTRKTMNGNRYYVVLDVTLDIPNYDPSWSLERFQDAIRGMN